VLEGLFVGLELPAASFSRAGTLQYPYLMEGHAARIGWGGQWVGQIGEVHPLVLRQFNLKTSAVIFEIEMAGLERQIPQRGAAAGLPRFPAVARDLTLIVDREREAGELVSGLAAVGESLLESVQLFAVYEGDPVPEGSKSVSLRMTYRSASQTLSDEQVNQVHRGIAQIMLERFKGSLPG
jgi:phenylalanyl-tRNA synthetase beta chain